jgi:choloylglycine hydrolase
MSINIVVGMTPPPLITDGINENGLTAHLLMQEDSNTPNSKTSYYNTLISWIYNIFGLSLHKKDPSPSINALSWIQYALSNYANVNEVIKGLQNYHIDTSKDALGAINSFISFKSMPVHFAIYDSKGDAAIIEFNNNKLEIFHNRRYNVMTNAPNLPSQLDNLEKTKKDKKYYSIMSLPGGAASCNRFIRASFYIDTMTEPKNISQAISYMQSAINGISVQSYDDKSAKISYDTNAWTTRWHVIYDLKNLAIYFEHDETGKKFYFQMKKYKFTDNSVRRITLADMPSKYEF